MVQPTFFDLFGAPLYIWDCSSFLTLDGKHLDGKASPYSPAEQAAIWHEVGKVCSEGRLRVCEQVKGELDRLAPDALERITKMRSHRMPPRGDAIIRLYQEVTGKYPRMVRKVRANPGDPWIVAWGRLMAARNAVVVTEETPLSLAKNRAAAKRKSHNGPPLPDLCDEYHVRWTNLEGFVRDRGLFP